MLEARDSYFDIARNISFTKARELGPKVVKAWELLVPMQAHLGTTETINERLLPGFAVVREFLELSQAGEAVSKGSFSETLEQSGVLQGEVWTFQNQRDTLVKAHLADRQAIDAALDTNKKQ